jgi:hypothetical protein
MTKDESNQNFITPPLSCFEYYWSFHEGKAYKMDSFLVRLRFQYPPLCSSIIEKGWSGIIRNVVNAPSLMRNPK